MALRKPEGRELAQKKASREEVHPGKVAPPALDTERWPAPALLTTHGRVVHVKTLTLVIHYDVVSSEEHHLNTWGPEVR